MIRLRLVIGPVVVIDLDLLSHEQHDDSDEPPAWIAGGQGSVIEPRDPDDVRVGFRPPPQR